MGVLTCAGESGRDWASRVGEGKAAINGVAEKGAFGSCCWGSREGESVPWLMPCRNEGRDTCERDGGLSGRGGRGVWMTVHDTGRGERASPTAGRGFSLTCSLFLLAHAAETPLISRGGAGRGGPNAGFRRREDENTNLEPLSDLTGEGRASLPADGAEAVLNVGHGASRRAADGTPGTTKRESLRMVGLCGVSWVGGRRAGGRVNSMRGKAGPASSPDRPATFTAVGRRRRVTG